MPATDQDWARAYAKQALSDLDAREKLERAGAHKCHRLHFLQMAAEKLCKAYLTTSNGHENIRKTHAYIERNLPLIARNFYRGANNSRIPAWEISEIRRIARQVELLAPACDDGGTRQDNSEYPWEEAQGNVRVPSEYNFPNIDDGPTNKAIVKLIRLIRTASEVCA
ncbi:MAG: hypothetical protein WBC78_22935 [Candidatus Sulfotelmatobacter sp.]